MNIHIPFVDAFLNKITMYRLVLNYLVVVNAAALILSFFNFFSFTPWALLFSFFFITTVCWISNEGLARAFKVTPNTESVFITAFILVLIMNPVWLTDLHGALMLALAAAAAMASKYVLAINKKHLFNPAAVGAAVTGVCFGTYASWWVGGTLSLLPFVLVGGLLIIRKVQRFEMFFAFATVALAGVAVHFLPNDPLDSIWQTLLHSSLLYFATIMLTEPLTSPHTRIHRLGYAAITGFFFIPRVHIGSFYFSPELALLVGNMYSYIVSPKVRRILTLKKREEVADGVHHFVFTPNKPFAFNAGQYLEWTLGHKNPDQRGNRRYFTIASSPTDEEIHLGVKTHENPSTFKKALLALEPGQTVAVGQLSGEFILPKNKDKKVAFIAGGIGITPFRSIVEHMIATNDRRGAVLLYSNKNEREIAYKDVFDRAHAALGMKSVYWVSDQMGLMDAECIKREVPDYKDRVFYISGPHAMVVAFQKSLRQLGVPRRNIQVDFFPGFV